MKRNRNINRQLTQSGYAYSVKIPKGLRAGEKLTVYVLRADRSNDTINMGKYVPILSYVKSQNICLKDRDDILRWFLGEKVVEKKQ